jgi:N-acetyl sugar amidotransferase
MKKIRYCRSCVYPQITVNLHIDDDGICASCRVAEQFGALSSGHWEKRKQKFERLLESILRNNTSDYDCVIPVSGGKDSYFQAHMMTKEYGLRALLVTYHGNNYLPEGDYNRDRMKEVFDADHLVFSPPVDVLKKLNRICFRRMGDMNWHAHCGITTYPIIQAVRHHIPLIIWGEIPWDISGMFDPDDYVEFSARERHEHSLRGYEWYDLLNDPQDPLTGRELAWAKYPTDEAILQHGTRGLYLGNFFPWDSHAHTKQMQELYGWREAERPFERTYRLASNLDDRYENGVHDLMKFVKFGYGRGSDHASKDIRSGRMTRAEGIEMVRRYDAVVSADLPYWCEYVGMSPDEFWSVADTFRDPRVWWIRDGQWWKDNVWGEPAAYGEVRLPAALQERYRS